MKSRRNERDGEQEEEEEEWSRKCIFKTFRPHQIGRVDFIPDRKCLTNTHVRPPKLDI